MFGKRNEEQVKVRKYIAYAIASLIIILNLALTVWISAFKFWFDCFVLLLTWIAFFIVMCKLHGNLGSLNQDGFSAEI